MNFQSLFTCTILFKWSTSTNHTFLQYIQKSEYLPWFTGRREAVFLDCLVCVMDEKYQLHRKQTHTHTHISSEVASFTCCCLSHLDLKNIVSSASYRSHASPHMLPVLFNTSKGLQCLWFINEYRCCPEAMLLFTLIQDIKWSAMGLFHA